MKEKVKWINFEGEKRLFTLNLAKGVRVYDERLVNYKREEYRLWDPFRSKLSAAIYKGLKVPLKEGYKVLYLGASTGTTLSHVSDIIGEKGMVYAVEVSARVARELLDKVVKFRKNVIPIIEDGRYPDKYGFVFGKVDLVYCDIAQPDQTEIAIMNCKKYLKEKGSLLLAVKARSIDAVKEPKEVYKDEVKKLKKNGFVVKEILDLEPYDRDHIMVHAIYSG
ncbi:MAG: fibrillarin-like rRNA/tRNA 2'-O-methyltransferase [Nitrososphaerales archaeon]